MAESTARDIVQELVDRFCGLLTERPAWQLQGPVAIYPNWVEKVVGSDGSGVYVFIGSISGSLGGRVLYVGESQSSLGAEIDQKLRSHLWDRIKSSKTAIDCYTVPLGPKEGFWAPALESYILISLREKCKWPIWNTAGR